MAPADNTPDFDSMTPEEIMAWMETLAKRQGVKSEELTTSADMDIPEIDPNTVVIDEPGYVPYGEERPPKPSAPPARSEPPMAAQPPRASEPAAPPRTFSAPPPRPQTSAEPSAPARPASPLTSRPTPQVPSGLNPLRPPSVPPNRPMPTPPSTPARSTPDFSSRPPSQPPSPTRTPTEPPAQSAPPTRTPFQTTTPNTPPSRPAPQPPAQSAPPTRPASQPPTQSAPQSPQNPRTAFEPPKWLTSRPTASTPAAPPPLTARTESEPPKAAPRAPEPGPISGDTDAMAWLESLAADSSDSLFNLDLSALIGEPESEPEPAKPVDTVSWLQNLTKSQGEDDSTAVFEHPQVTEEARTPVVEARKQTSDVPTVADPFDAGVDPMAWLENLARRQGAKDEELTTSTRMDIPVPENPIIEEPGYTPFSFDAPIERHKPPTPNEKTPFTLENPADWLNSLADSEGFDEDILGPLSTPALTDDGDLTDIEQAISTGTVSPEQMQTYLEHQTDRYVEEMAGEAAPVDEDAPPIPADLPDWLLEQVGSPPADLPLIPVAEADVEPSSLPSMDDMPDWLRDEAAGPDAANFMNIFDTEVDAEDSEAILAEPAFAGYKLEIDRSDPWVEAFEEEQEESLPDVTELPGWYVENVNNPERVAAVEQLAGEPTLADAILPEETELVAGVSVDVPAWATLGSPAVEAAVSDIPDWLREIETTVEPDEIPNWLTESMDETAETFDDEPVFPAATAMPTPMVEPEPVIVTLPPVQLKPEPVVAAAPIQQPAASVDLQTARSHASGGNLESSVASYEALIRANRELDDVVDDLTRLSKAHRGNPAVHRVLGDGLMRQGKLQAALDVYREALNQL